MIQFGLNYFVFWYNTSIYLMNYYYNIHYTYSITWLIVNEIDIFLSLLEYAIYEI